MRTCLYDHGLSLLRAWFKKGSGIVAGTARRVLRTTVPDPFLNLLFSFGGFCPCGWGLVLASMLTVVLMSTGCDPKAPPVEDLGTVLHRSPVVAGSEEPYEFPEDVARRVDEVEAKRAESKGSMGR